MGNKKRFPITNIGTVTLLMIFIVICMVVFTVLTVSESAADYNFGRKLADQTTDYYAACSRAEEVLAELDRQAAGSRVYFSVPINDRLELAVAAEFTGNGNGNKDGDGDGNGNEDGTRNYRIIRWEEQRSGTWQGDNTLNLLQP